MIPFVLRKTPNKPLRVYLQDGENDVDNEHGSWWISNQQMAAALKYKKYDYQFITGKGYHNGKHAGSVFPDALKWLWRETK